MAQATCYDVATLYGGDKHPDHDTICSFRLNNRPAFKEAFVKVLMLAGDMIEQLELEIEEWTRKAGTANIVSRLAMLSLRWTPKEVC